MLVHLYFFSGLVPDVDLHYTGFELANCYEKWGYNAIIVFLFAEPTTCRAKRLASGGVPISYLARV